MPPDLVARACGGAACAGGAQGGGVPVRLAALDAIAGGGAELRLRTAISAALARDPAAEIRRAAVLVAAAGPERDGRCCPARSPTATRA